MRQGLLAHPARRVINYTLIVFFVLVFMTSLHLRTRLRLFPSSSTFLFQK